MKLRIIAGRPYTPISSVEVDQAERRMDEPEEDVLAGMRLLVVAVVVMMLALAAALIYRGLP